MLNSKKKQKKNNENEETYPNSYLNTYPNNEADDTPDLLDERESKAKPASAFDKILSSVKESVEAKVNRLKSSKIVDELNFDKPIQAGSAEEQTFVKRIVNGLIETTDGSFVRIQEVSPILFSLLADSDKTEIVNNYAAWLRICPMTVQIKTISRRANPRRHIAEVMHDLENEKSPKVRRMGENYIDFVSDASRTMAKTRRWFVIFRYTGIEKDIWAIYSELDSAAATLMAILDMCGNTFPSTDDIDASRNTMEILYLLFNRKAYIDEPFSARYARVKRDIYAESKRNDPFAPIPNIAISRALAPHGLNFTRPDYYIQDGLYCGTFAIKGASYPSEVHAGWTAWLYNMTQDCDIDIFLQKQEGMSERVGSRVRNNKSKFRDTADTQRDFYDLNSSINSGYFILESLANGQQFFYVSILLTITAETEKKFYSTKAELQKAFSARMMQLSYLKYMQQAAYRSVLPFARLDPDIASKARRNMMTMAVASMYPFNQFEMTSDSGIFLGINRANGSLCIVDLFNKRQLFNSNVLLLGPTGYGKTFTTQTITLRSRMRGMNVIIIAPMKGFEYARACREVGGEFIQITPESRNCINIMEIRDTGSENMELLYGMDTGSLLTNKVQTLLVFLELLKGGLTIEEEHLCEEAIIKTYTDFGFTYDNNSLYLDRERTEKRTMPIIGDLYERISAYKQLRNVSSLLERYVTGSARMWNGQTNVDLDNPYVVLDLSNLKGPLLPVGYFIATDFVNDRVRRDVTERKMVVFDEVWNMIGSGASRKTAQYVLEIIKTIRGYGGSAMVATQGLADFEALDNGAYGREIINNCAVKILLGIPEYKHEAEKVIEAFSLTPAEAKSITLGNKRDKKGNGLLILAGSKIEINVAASELEHKLITTNSDELKQIAIEKKEQARKKEIERLAGESKGDPEKEFEEDPKREETYPNIYPNTYPNNLPTDTKEVG